MAAALNGLDILAADIGNAHLNVPAREKIFITCGPEFGPPEGWKARAVRALCGLKSSGAVWRPCLSEALCDLGFLPCKADNDVWIEPAMRANGSRCHEMVLVCTDDTLCVSENPDHTLCKLNQHFSLKPHSIREPKQCLGASVKRFKLPNSDKECWAMGSQQHVKEAVRNVKNWLDKRGLGLKTRAPLVLPMSHKPKLDATPLCDDDKANCHQQQIGVPQWAVELGRADTCAEVSMMASHCAAPRVGHFDAAFHMCAHLNGHERSHSVFDPDCTNHLEAEEPNWTDFHRDREEEPPPDTPKPLGEPVQLTAFVDSDHAGDKVTRRSRTGALVFANMSPVAWHSKKQSSVESSSFGSEFSAMKTGVEIIEGLRHKP